MKQNDTKYLVIGGTRYPTSSGNEYYVEREFAGIDENGEWILKDVNKIKISDYINSFVDTCDMQIILQKLKEGDTSVLNQRAAFYGDAVNVPHTPMEALNIMKDSKLAYDRLSDEVKAKFDNDFQKWFSSVATVDWFDKMGMLKKDEVPTSVQEDKAAAAES